MKRRFLAMAVATGLISCSMLSGCGEDSSTESEKVSMEQVVDELCERYGYPLVEGYHYGGCPIDSFVSHIHVSREGVIEFYYLPDDNLDAVRYALNRLDCSTLIVDMIIEYSHYHGWEDFEFLHLADYNVSYDYIQIASDVHYYHIDIVSK